MATTVKKLTYADYEKIPEDGFRHEIIEGEEFMTPAPEVPHQLVVTQLVGLLNAHVRNNRSGKVLAAPTDVVLSAEDIVQPDVLFIATGHADRITQRNIQGAPDLVIEVLSPSTASVDRGRKLDLYAGAGIAEYWIADPSTRTMEIHEFGSPRRTRIYKEDQTFETTVLPGLIVRLADIF